MRWITIAVTLAVSQAGASDPSVYGNAHCSVALASWGKFHSTKPGIDFTVSDEAMHAYISGWLDSAGITKGEKTRLFIAVAKTFCTEEPESPIDFIFTKSTPIFLHYK